MSTSTRAPFGHTTSQNAARTVLGLALAAAAVSASTAATVHAAGSLRAALAARENPVLPLSLEVAALYGLGVLRGASPAAEAFAAFLRGEGGQAVLRGYGFSSP
jgi:ABC-type molybdate transport system substrate-binding protein